VTSTETLSLRWETLTADAVPAWTELTNVLAEYDDTGEYYSAEDLAEELGEHGFTAERDSWAVWDGDCLVAYGKVSVGLIPDHEARTRCTLEGGVRPSHRGRGIGSALLTRMEARALELARERHPGVPAYWRFDGGQEGASVRALAAHRGYGIVRYFAELERPLPGHELSGHESVPEGITLLSPAAENEEATRRAHNEAFQDHWGSGEMTVERWHDFWTARANRWDLSTLAVDADGNVLAYALAGSWVERELYVLLVGSVRAARGRGLATASLARMIRLARESGHFDAVDLHVDSDSPTGATRLYEKLGFVTTRVFATLQRDAG